MIQLGPDPNCIIFAIFAVVDYKFFEICLN